MCLSAEAIQVQGQHWSRFSLSLRTRGLMKDKENCDLNPAMWPYFD